MEINTLIYILVKHNLIPTVISFYAAQNESILAQQQDMTYF